MKQLVCSRVEAEKNGYRNTLGGAIRKLNRVFAESSGRFFDQFVEKAVNCLGILDFAELGN